MKSKPHGDGGKTHARRNENTQAVEANWGGINWNAREEERQAEAARLRAEGKDFTAHAVETGFLPIEAVHDGHGFLLLEPTHANGINDLAAVHVATPITASEILDSRAEHLRKSNQRMSEHVDELLAAKLMEAAANG